MRNSGPFSRLVSEFGGATEEKREEEEAEEEEAIETAPIDDKVSRLSRKHMGKAAGTGKLEVSTILQAQLTQRAA
jgi:CO dehydrogenase/acetyl-CoA synthase beta subunit